MRMDNEIHPQVSFHWAFSFFIFEALKKVRNNRNTLLKTPEKMPLKAHPCQAAEKGWHDFAGSQILSINQGTNLRQKLTSLFRCFDRLDKHNAFWLILRLTLMSIWSHLFFSAPKSNRFLPKKSPCLIGESLDGFLSPHRHHTSESSQTRRPRPLRRSKWAKCSPSLRSGLKIWPKMLQKSCWKKWALESTPKNNVMKSAGKFGLKQNRRSLESVSNRWA